jgi:hypothetical protein
MFFVAQLGAKTPSCPGVSAQRQFSAEDERVKCPVTLPAKVGAALAKDPYVVDLLSRLGLPAGTVPRSWYLASEVRLNGPGERHFVVIGNGPLLGANVTKFWIFGLNRGRVTVPLSAAVAHDLIINETSSNGYKNIELLAGTAVTVSTVLLKFKNGRYTVARSKLEEIR